LINILYISSNYLMVYIH